MKNFTNPGRSITVAAPYALSSGDGCLVGSLFGVAAFDALITAAVEVWTEGVFNITKAAPLVITQGDVLYWDDTAKSLSKTSTGVPVAVCVTSAGSSATTVNCRLTSGYTAPLAASILNYASVTVTNAQIKLLNSAAKTLVAAPGSGKFLEFVSAVLVNSGGANALTESADNLAIKLVDGSGAQVSQDIETTGFIDQTAKTITNALPKIDAIVASASGANKALVLVNSGNGEYGGNAAADITLTVLVAYRVHSV